MSEAELSRGEGCSQRRSGVPPAPVPRQGELPLSSSVVQPPQAPPCLASAGPMQRSALYVVSVYLHRCIRRQPYIPTALAVGLKIRAWSNYRGFIAGCCVHLGWSAVHLRLASVAACEPQGSPADCLVKSHSIYVSSSLSFFGRKQNGVPPGSCKFSRRNPLSPGDCVLELEIKFLNPQRSVRLEKVSYCHILVGCK